jgi:predicted porin
MDRAYSWRCGIAGAVLLCGAGAAHGQTADAARIKALQDQIDALQRTLNEIRAASGNMAPSPASAAPAAAPAAISASAAAPAPAYTVPAAATELAPASHGFLEKKPGNALTFYTPHGEITGYGQLDLSVDDTTKGLHNAPNVAVTPPVGRVGWLPDESTNNSLVGIRGFQTLGDRPFNFIYQLETQIDVSSSSGIGESNSNESNVVKGGLTSRPSFIGLASDEWGAIKFGKADAPYKDSTARMNPFAGELGDYAVIMGNTGGDNRVEFATRLEHSIWYESPSVGGFRVNALYSPGQNRASDSDNIDAGTSDCAGGNIPGSGGIGVSPSSGLPVCNDGAFSDAYSADIVYERGPLYIVAAYERHQKVDRSSDITGQFADITTPGSTGNRLFNQDVADEDAAKIGIQYKFPTGTTANAIFEDLHRYLPADLEFQNERQRTGWWLALSQQLAPDHSIHLGWAHANRTPGDPGQHNDGVNTPPGGAPGVDFTAGANSDNAASMFTVAYKFQIASDLTWYTDWALTDNGPAAHYDLGAGGRSVTTDCHDAFGAAGGESPNSNPHCFTGGKLMGVSTGMAYRF